MRRAAPRSDSVKGDGGPAKRTKRPADRRAPELRRRGGHGKAIAARFRSNERAARIYRAAADDVEASDPGLAKTLRAAADALGNCRHVWRQRVHVPCGSAVGGLAETIACGDRLGCAHCAHVRASRVANRVALLFEEVRRPKMLTLTVRNLVGVESLTGDTYTQLLAAFRRFRKLIWQRLAPLERNPATGRLRRGATPLRGGVYAFEVTFHELGAVRWHKATDPETKRPTGKLVANGVYEDDEWHPHLHCLIDSDYMDQATIAGLWNEATEGWGTIVDIREIKGGLRKGVAELAKYATKVVTMTPRALVRLREVLKGRRLVAPFGTMRGVKVEEDDDHEEDVVEESCDCGREGCYRDVWDYFGSREATEILVERGIEALARAGP